jgi:hypothetical protein
LGENEITRIKELVIDVLLPPSLSRRVCLLKAPSGREERRRERKDNASQNGGELGEEDMEDAKRKS